MFSILLMAANHSIIDLTEDSFVEEYVSTNEDIRFDDHGGLTNHNSGAADESLMFVAEYQRPVEPNPRIPLRSRQVHPSQSSTAASNPNRRPKASAKQLPKPAVQPVVESENVATGARRHSEGQPSCPICMETFKEIKTNGLSLMSTPCGHIFCSTCLEMTKKSKPSRCRRTGAAALECPSCRKPTLWKTCHQIFI